MYPIGNKASATAAVSNMDRTIEKCRKAIKLHSIRKTTKKLQKPTTLNTCHSTTRMSSIRHRTSLMLLGRQNFNSKATFGFCRYIFHILAGITHRFRKWWCNRKIWTARLILKWTGYKSRGRTSKSIGIRLPAKHRIIRSCQRQSDDKKGQYKEAIPFLKLAIENEKTKTPHPFQLL